MITKGGNILAEYIPVDIYLKNKKDKITINAPIEDLCDFEDWLNQNGANKDKWKKDKFDLDDAVTGSTYQIFRNHIQMIEWPFVCVTDNAIKQGIYVLDVEKFKKAHKRK